MSSDQATTIGRDERTDDSNEDFFEADKQPVRCLCPKCGIPHILNIYWTGTTTPRKYCQRCREAISSVNEQYIYEIVPNMFRIHRGVATQPSDG